MSLREQLTALYDEHGRLTAELVVDAARPRNHPLHSRFEWDNRVAGEKYRQVQAADLIRSVKISRFTGDADDSDVRAFHSVTRADGPVYEPIEEIMADEVSMQTVLRQAEREWRALHARYKHLAEFLKNVREDVA
jgi:hypothetical protein